LPGAVDALIPAPLPSANVSSVSTDTAAVILAAGQGTRMRSRIPKVLHPLAGRPLIDHVLTALADAGIARPVVVTGSGADAVEAAIGGQAATVRQEPQRGTADAVACALPFVPDATTTVVVTMGDAPLLRAATFAALADELAASESAIALTGAELSDPTGYGRIVRSSDGSVAAVVEEADADEATRAIREINAGTYAFDAAWLRSAIGRVEPSAGGELYLTDLVALAASDGRGVRVVMTDAIEALGINDRVALAEAERIVQRRIGEAHMRNGVTIVDPSTTRIDASVEIGQDARIEPWTVLTGRTSIDVDAVVGPHAHVRDSRIGARTSVWASVVEEATVAEDVVIGPFAHLRPGSEIGPRCRIGNFAEIKKSRLGAGTQQHHFSYLGDAEIGEDVNVGAGSVTANFDGTDKHPTIIGDRVSLGVDSMLVAPVTIGEGARTGAGAVVTRDVAPGKTVVGMPARPIGGPQTRREAARTPPDGR
jgi:bifunctional UDP-N-acetylglucosamine pyrophosphorylase/glucosamine-1-phosphate N-acetyltransferase